MPRPYRLFPRRRKPLVIGGSVALSGQIRIGLNPSVQDGWNEPVNQPLRARIPKRQQPQYDAAKRFLVTTSSTTTLTGQIRVASNPSLNPTSWLQPKQQPLRSRVPKRQQPFYPFDRFLVTATNNTTLTGQIRVSANPATDPAVWVHPTNQPQRSNKAKKVIEIPGGQLSSVTEAPYISYWVRPVNQPLRHRWLRRQQVRRITSFATVLTTTNATTLTGQIRIAPNPSLEPIWKHLTEQPLKSRVPKRQQPAYPFLRYLVTASNSTTLTGQIRVSINPSLEGSLKQPVNQPSRRHYINKRQQPNAAHLRPLVTSSNTTTLTGQIRVASNPAINPSSWLQPKQQPLKGRVPRRQQFPLPGGHFLITASNQTSLTGQIRISTNPSLNIGWVHQTNQPWPRRVRRIEITGGELSSVTEAPYVSYWVHPTQQPLRSRVPRRQQPIYDLAKRFLVTGTNSTTLNGQIRVAANPSTNASVWAHAAQQPLRSRILRRQQPSAVSKSVLVIGTNTTSLGGQIRISLNPSTTGGWKQPVNQPWRRRVWRIEIPGGELSSITEAPYVSYWKQPTNEPLRQRWLRRQQVARITNVAAILSGTRQTTLSGQIRIAANPATNPNIWIHLVNQPRPRRSKVIEVAGKAVSTNATVPLVSQWGRPTNQPLRNRVPKRQQPFAIDKRFLITVANTTTLTGQIRIAFNPGTQPSWIRPVNQPLRKRVLKRQQPQYPSRRYLPTISNTATITGQLRVSTNPATKQIWKQPVNQPQANRNRKLTAMRYHSAFKMITLLGSHPTTPIILSQNDNVSYLGMDGSQPLTMGLHDTAIYLGQNDDATTFDDDDNNSLYM